MQAFWARKQCEIGIGCDIISDNGVIIDRKTFVEVLGVVLPRFLDSNTLFSVLDPNRSGFIAIHMLHVLVSIYSLHSNCELAKVVTTALRAASWEILNCRVHKNCKVRSSLSTADKAMNAAQIAAQKHLEENTSLMQEKELKVKIEANNTRMKEHLRKKVAEELMDTLNEEAGNELEEEDEDHEDFAMLHAMLPPVTLNSCIRAICTSPESEKRCSLSLFVLIKKAQAENIWDENFMENNRGYRREDVRVSFAVDYLANNEDDTFLLMDEFRKMRAKIGEYGMMRVATH